MCKFKSIQLLWILFFNVNYVFLLPSKTICVQSNPCQENGVSTSGSAYYKSVFVKHPMHCKKIVPNLLYPNETKQKRTVQLLLRSTSQ